MAQLKPSLPRHRPVAAANAAELQLRQLCQQRGHRLTPMRIAVYRYLASQPRPQTAYQVLDGVQKSLDKKVGALSVYRALDFLAGEGLLHRLESTRSFAVCADPHHHHDGVLFLCVDCGKAEEANADQVESLIQKNADRLGFHSQRKVVEVIGVCRNCHS